MGLCVCVGWGDNDAGRGKQAHMPYMCMFAADITLILRQSTSVVYTLQCNKQKLGMGEMGRGDTQR